MLHHANWYTDYQTTWCHNPADCNPNMYCKKHLKSHIRAICISTFLNDANDAEHKWEKKMCSSLHGVWGKGIKHVITGGFLVQQP